VGRVRSRSRRGLPSGSGEPGARLNVGISLLTLVPRISGGSETYARELVRALGRIGEHSYRVLLPTIAPDVDGLPAEVVEEYRASTSMPGRIAAMSEGIVRAGGLRRRLAGCDVVHFPLTVMIPRVTTPPAVTTVLDLQHEFLPAFFSRAERLYRRAVYGWSIRKSRLVVTISEHAARAVVERYSLPEERVQPIHLGLDHATFSPGDGPRERFLVYPARTWPHKNHERLFTAFGQLRARHPDLELVLTAYEGRTPSGVRSLGHVSRDELVRLYRTAAGLVFPSLYEGFGQPPLEAMACGCPVASSNAAALPEVCGDAARLFDPTSVEDMVAAVEEILARPEGWSAKGVARAAEFSWDETARAHDAAYAAVADDAD
jgi:glycosyltransferase involved in cell wall biosynthesis